MTGGAFILASLLVLLEAVGFQNIALSSRQALDFLLEAGERNLLSQSKFGSSMTLKKQLCGLA